MHNAIGIGAYFEATENNTYNSPQTKSGSIVRMAQLYTPVFRFNISTYHHHEALKASSTSTFSGGIGEAKTFNDTFSIIVKFHHRQIGISSCSYS